ncbi:DUF4198 domain-containing protein [Candidatus Aminicenantes bacterium AC-334-K16]|jgi:uncharacterized GH25 family protein|nr:DUF4198 domain-containing protein [Candidatus Aminicenantes bacterium AC-334-K16]
MKKGNIILSIFITGALVISLSAHDLWLVPQQFRLKPGEKVTILANTGMDFPHSLNAVTPERIKQFFLWGPAGKKEITQYQVQGKSLVVSLSLPEEGTYVIAAALKPKEIRLTAEEFNEYLLHDGLTRIYRLRQEKGLLQKSAVEHYAKFPKTVVQVGLRLTSNPSQPVGLPVEIVPLVNPYQLKEGDRLKIRVLFQGKPLAQAEVAWSYPGRGEEFAETTTTNNQGETVIPLEKAGPYVIRLTHMEWVRKPSHEWESFWSSLTFEVLPAK